ncbi:sigma-70 family RNA polymerase sigma factor [Mastigocladus laminosus UU774]|nr:sigma-70 family RNA polymerase sigma factor [Mastigocladus laminosus UU774]
MGLTQESWSDYTEMLLQSGYRQRLEKIARKYTKGTGLSWEDAIQNAHLKIIQAFQSDKFHQGGVEQFYRWAITVARYAIIDFVRQESLRKCQSLDCNIPGTDICLLDTIPDEFSILEATEHRDLILKAIEAIYQLDQCYPHQKYLQLWQAKIHGKTQNQVAAELRVSQSEISKRWQELLGRIAKSLEL